MVASSQHPAAMRSYARAGFDLHPTLTASGPVRRETIPAGLAVRDGEAQDLDLASEVDRTIRGGAHGPDLEYMLTTTSCRLLVAEGPSGRGYAAERNGSPAILAAAEPEVARDLLWACLERTRRARRQRSTGSRAGRTGQCRWCWGPASRSPPSAPSAPGETSVP